MVFIGLSAFVGSTLRRMRSLDGLPDVGDPFDVAELRRPIEIPDADNAFVAYEAAHRMLMNPPNPADEARSDWLHGAVYDDETKPVNWSSAPPGVRDYLEAKRAALEIWREGSGRRDAVYYQPSRTRVDTGLYLLADATTFAAMAALEGSRLEDAGALDEAWDWYRAMLRSSRLIGRHGFLVQRFRGAKVHALAARCILRWAADPRVDAARLRRALNDTLAADALTPPISEAVKISYLSSLNTVDSLQSYESTLRSLGGPVHVLGGTEEGALDRLLPWPVRLQAQRLHLRASNELERSRRVFRLLFANWLAQADRPAGQQAPLAFPTLWIHADDPSAPAAARAVTPESLAEAIERLHLAFLFSGGADTGGPPWGREGALARERRRRSVLIVRLAAELYRREHGAAPATAGALLGSILEERPEGIAPDDPIPAGPE